MTGDVLVDAFTRGNVEKLKKSKLQKEGEQKKTKPAGENWRVDSVFTNLPTSQQVSIFTMVAFSCCCIFEIVKPSLMVPWIQPRYGETTWSTLHKIFKNPLQTSLSNSQQKTTKTTELVSNIFWLSNAFLSFFSFFFLTKGFWKKENAECLLKRQHSICFYHRQRPRNRVTNLFPSLSTRARSPAVKITQKEAFRECFFTKMFFLLSKTQLVGLWKPH